MNAIKNHPRGLRRTLPKGRDKGPPNPDALCHHTACFANDYEFILFGHIVQEFIRLNASDVIQHGDREFLEFQTDRCKSAPVLVKGCHSFLFGGSVHIHVVDHNHNRHEFRSSQGIEPFLIALANHAKNHNPLRGKHLQIRGTRSGNVTAHMQPPPVARLDDIALPPGVAADLRDNTVLHLRHLKGVNGIIFHGPPGTGKSVTCQALIRECLEAGFSSCFLNTGADFDLLGDFVRNYLSPCLLILEDVDNFGEDRLKGRGSNFSDFLQFLSGLSEHAESIVVIATTNHYELLDAAIRDRPVRFNRQFHFGKPGLASLIEIFRSRFEGVEPPAALLRRFESQGFTGAHVTELHRTAKLISLKSGKPMGDCLDEAFHIILRHFAKDSGPLGFALNA